LAAAGSFDDEGLEYPKSNFKAAVGGKRGRGGERRYVLIDVEEVTRAAGRKRSLQKL
jgi:hypothetical protein